MGSTDIFEDASALKELRRLTVGILRATSTGQSRVAESMRAERTRILNTLSREHFPLQSAA